MRLIGQDLLLSAHDLVGNLFCAHLTALDLQVARGRIAKPARLDPMLEILRERGQRHEDAFIDHLVESGISPVRIAGADITPEAVSLTKQAMHAGAEIIVQAALSAGRWSGRADVLRRVEIPSDLGTWSYEVLDTKLARETKGGTILQLCLYADLLTSMQGVAPEFVYVVVPWSDYQPQRFRYADYGAFYRRTRQAAQDAIDLKITESVTYPEPKDHCEICRWEARCEAQRRDDDHLCLVANVSKLQINELRANGVETAKALSQLVIPLQWKPKRGAPEGYSKAQAQARIQVEARETSSLRHELLPIGPGVGLCLLPPPSEADVFFDIEGDPFVGEGGLEYLFGYWYRDGSETMCYQAIWATDRASEKAAFEAFMDFVTERRAQFPEMHIFHYAPYEPAALKRLMGRYASRQTEVDNLLRGKTLVDLYSVVRNGLRASVESYSIKKLEAFYSYTREMSLREANVALAAVQAALELGEIQEVDIDVRHQVAMYNRDDCRSTEALRNWLEQLRSDAIGGGAAIARPSPGADGPTEEVAEYEAEVDALIERLTTDVSVDPTDRTAEQHARWILAHCLNWHGREMKAVWWEYFRLAALTSDELLEEKAGLGGLHYIDTVDLSKTGIPTDRYRFTPQDTDIRAGAKLRSVGGDTFGSVVTVSKDDRTVDIKKTAKTASIHPAGVYEHLVIECEEQRRSLLRLGTFVADNGIAGEGQYQAARDLLLRHPPRLGDMPLHVAGDTTLDAALRVSTALQSGVLPMQGPPGTGKSFTGAHMIKRLIRDGKRVGITANSHKVIRNLIDKTIEACVEAGQEIRAGQKPREKEADTPHLRIFLKNEAAITTIQNREISVFGATPFFWARQDAADLVDVLFVDEAAQMSLANVLAASPAAPRLVLLGDPQQLDQPSQGSHPDGTDVSTLDHVLEGNQTIAPERGVFLAQTWRMHPSVTNFISEAFYDAKLTSIEDCSRQLVISNGPFRGTGLRYVAAPHSGNQSSSIEEAEAVSRIVEMILSSNSHWTNRKGITKPVTIEDIIVIAPYNAQVFEIQQRIPGAHVGTVDKFQGQEAAIAIYSVTTSSHADAPRGMEFLYSSNRLNVAISRAMCIAIMVASPAIFEVECKTPRQMKLANAFCRYLEMAETVSIEPS